MIENDKQLDDFLKSGFESKVFEQKSVYWENAQRLIMNNRKGNSNILTYTLSVVVLVSAVAALWVSNTNAPLSAKQESSSPSYTAPVAINATTPASTRENQSAVAVSTVSESVTINAINNPVAEPETPATSINETRVSNTSNTQPSKTATPSVIAAPTNIKSVTPENNATFIAENAEHAAFTSRNSDLFITEIQSKHYRPLTVKNMLTDTFNKKDFYQRYSQQNNRSFFSIEGGITYYNAAAVNVHGGIKYNYFITPKLGINTGLTYSRLSQDISRTYQNIDYGFGQNDQTTTIRTKRIDYVELPVNLLFNVSNNHFVSLGTHLGYAIQSKDMVTATGSSKDTNSSGYLNAINRWDIQLNAGYSYSITKQWIVSANYYVGLKDVSKNNVFKNANFDNNNGLRLTIGYQLK